MTFQEMTGYNLGVTRDHLQAGLMVSLLGVWVLVGLFFYLNRHTRRQYFTIWASSWLFYALWLSLKFGVDLGTGSPLVLVLEQWCIGVSAVFLLWGSVRFLGHRVRHGTLGWFLAFLMAWSLVGGHYLSNRLHVEAPIFALIGAASLFTSVAFFRYRRRKDYLGASLLALGFLLWGSYMAAYPFLGYSEDLTTLALFILGGLQIFLAVSMIVLVLEEARGVNEILIQQSRARTIEGMRLKMQIESTEERYRSLFDQAAEAIVITGGEDLRILELNRAAQRLLGVTAEEASRHSLSAFCQVNASASAPPKDAGDWFQVICQQRPLKLVCKNGSVVPMEVDGTRIQYAGEPAYQFYLRELTERGRLEQQLRQAEKLSALGQMISGVAHELNNPLTVIKGYLDLVLSQHELSAETRADLKKVSRESSRAARLVQSFLSFAREQPAHRESVDLNNLIRRVVELRKFDAMVAGVEVALALDEDLPSTSADPDQIQQLLINLLNNSLQAMVEMNDPGRVKISSRIQDNQIRVLVEDNGPGVPEEIETRIFEPFFTTKEVGTGTGLGLSIAHSIMIEHNGRLLYRRSSLGGAGFILEFPIIKMQTTQKREEAGSAPPFRPGSIGRTGHVLVLDDEVGIAEMLNEMLSLLGHTAALSHSARHALELIGAQEFDLVISDFRMPGMNGQQFYEAVVKLKPDLAKRIVFVTGDVINEETQTWLKSTGNPHLAKPFQLQEVARILQEMMNPAPGSSSSREQTARLAGVT